MEKTTTNYNDNDIKVENMIITEQACSWYIYFTSENYERKTEEAEAEDDTQDFEIEFIKEEEQCISTSRSKYHAQCHHPREVSTATSSPPSVSTSLENNTEPTEKKKHVRFANSDKLTTVRQLAAWTYALRQYRKSECHRQPVE